MVFIKIKPLIYRYIKQTRKKLLEHFLYFCCQFSVWGSDLKKRCPTKSLFIIYF